jgi:hypothetical protein
VNSKFRVYKFLVFSEKSKLVTACLFFFSITSWLSMVKSLDLPSRRYGGLQLWARIARKTRNLWTPNLELNFFDCFLLRLTNSIILDSLAIFPVVGFQLVSLHSLKKIFAQSSRNSFQNYLVNQFIRWGHIYIYIFIRSLSVYLCRSSVVYCIIFVINGFYYLCIWIYVLMSFFWIKRFFFIIDECKKKRFSHCGQSIKINFMFLRYSINIVVPFPSQLGNSAEKTN